MEKIISPEERIRRAEEIYYRRRMNNDVRMSSSQVKAGGEKRQFSLYKKMFLQILICILIYLVFSLIKEANYLFSETVTNKTKEFLSQDINFELISSQVGNFFKNNQGKFPFFNTQDENVNDEETAENKTEADQNENAQTNQNNQNENVQNAENKENEEQTNQVPIEENQNIEQGNATKSVQTTGIGGGSEALAVPTVNTSTSQKSQMQIDADYIKENFSMQIPVKAGITSHYGKRTPTEIVSENHQGIDLGVVTGTTIVAAMEGKVSVVSKEGDYGVHVKIVNKDITTIYAHCSKILVKEGETIKKGQKIALSGNTGKTTGPHLHFEIQRSGRTIDPELILSWS